MTDDRQGKKGTMKSKTRSLITILFLLAMLVCVCSITAFGDDGSVKVVAGAGEQKSVTENSGVKTDSADAVTVIANGEGSDASAVIGGDVESDKGHGLVIEADQGKATAVINGQIETENQEGIEAKADNGGTINVKVDGDVESDGDAAIDAEAKKGSKISIVVGSEAEGKEEGLDLKVSEGGSIDVVVKDKVEGDKAGIVTNACTPDCDGTVSVTAWKIVVRKDGEGKEFVALDQNNAINSAFEKTIKYIIRIKNPEYISLPGLEKGEYGYTAYEGDTIKVRIDIPDGYELEHAYWDDDEELELIKGDDGFWYVRIPKGGGVTLSVDLDDDDDDDDSGEGYRASSPNTGDKEDLVMWSVVMLAAVVLLAGMLRKRALNR